MKRTVLRIWVCALLLCALTFATFPGTTAKYVKQTDTVSYTLSVTPLTENYILRRGALFSHIVNTEAPEIEIIYFINQARSSYTEGVGGKTHTEFLAGSYWNWESGVDVGVTNNTIRFFYDSATKTGYVIAKGDHIIQENTDTTYMFYGLSSLKEAYFIDYNGKISIQKDQINVS